MQPASTQHRSWLTPVIFIVFWTVVVLAFAAQLVFSAAFPWKHALLASLNDWLPWVLLSPGIVWLARRFPLEWGHLRASVPAHLVGCFLTLVLCGWISDLFFAAFVQPEMTGRPRPEATAVGKPRLFRDRPGMSPEAAPPGGPPPPEDGGPRPGPGAGVPPMPGDPPGPRREFRAERPADGRPRGLGRRGPWDRHFWAVVFWNRAKLNLPVYWVIVSAVHAFGFYRRVQERDRRALELTASLSRAKVEALRLQMQPHFLFNTLNAISALVHRDPDAADEMIVNLSELLRLSLDTAEQEVPLRRELELLDRYLEIERVRLGERLRVQREIAAEVLDAAVPTLMLQTLVENAVRHGIEPRESGGTVTVVARRDGDRLRIEVRDDGVGFGAADARASRRGVGLANTQSRLRELYGDAATFVIHSPEAGGVTIELLLPLRWSETTAS